MTIDYDKIARLADGVAKLSARFDAMIKNDAEKAKVPEGRQNLSIKSAPMRPEDLAYQKQMISKAKPQDRRPYNGPKYDPN